MVYKIDPPNTEKDKDVVDFLAEKKITEFLGGGAESWVYALDDTHIMRISKEKIDEASNEQTVCPLKYAEDRKIFYQKTAAFKLPFALPQIFSVGREGNIVYTIENRIQGSSLHHAFIENPENREQMLRNYFDAVEQLTSIELKENPFGVVLTPDTSIPYSTKPSWVEYLQSTIIVSLKENGKKLADAGVHICNATFNKLLQKIEACFKDNDKHNLVHGDIFPPNVMIDPKTLKITGIIDFSDLTVIGDHRLDIAAALIQTEYLDPYGKEYSSYMKNIVKEKYGDELNEVINLYRIYYSFLFMEKWSIKNLKNIEELLNTDALWSPFDCKPQLEQAAHSVAAEDKTKALDDSVITAVLPQYALAQVASKKLVIKVPQVQMKGSDESEKSLDSVNSQLKMKN